MSDDSDKNTPKPDLSALSDFQFGPSWAREKNSHPKEFSHKEYKERNFDRNSSKPGFNRDSDRRKGGDRPFSRNGDTYKGKRDFAGGERKFSPDRQDRDHQDRSKSRFPRNGRRPEQGEREKFAPEPAKGIRAEIRPINSALASIAAEIHKHKRSYSLYDLAKVFMGGRERYEIWYIREENGPNMILCKKSPAVWLDEKEALASLWGSAWFSEFYEERVEETEAPKGQFTAIARCGMSDTLIGPVNWHGYQVALAKLHAERFSHLPFEKFRSRITIEKSEEVVAQWLESATKRTVWVAKREGAGDTVLQEKSDVDADFKKHHFDETFESTGKCFVPGDIVSKNLSLGLFAHLLKLVEAARRHPAQIIPNVCHGLARHHLPIFKWNGGHHTGPSRPHALPDETQLAERPAAIIEWAIQNPGKTVEAMITSLAESAEKAGASLSEETPVSQPVEEKEESVASTPEVDSAPAEATSQEVATTEPAEEKEESVTAPEQEAPSQEEQAPVAEKTPEKAAPSAPEAPKSLITRLQEAFISDMMWLLQQGFIIVTADGKIYYPKTASQPEATSSGKSKKAKPAKKAKAPKPETAKPAKAEAAPEEVKAEEATEEQPKKAAAKPKKEAEPKKAKTAKPKKEVPQTEESKPGEPAPEIASSEENS